MDFIRQDKRPPALSDHLREVRVFSFDIFVGPLRVQTFHDGDDLGEGVVEIANLHLKIVYTLVHHIWLGVSTLTLIKRRPPGRSKLENLDEASTGEACVAEEEIEGLEPLRERERLLIVHVFDDGGGVYFSVVRGGFQTAAAVFIGA